MMMAVGLRDGSGGRDLQKKLVTMRSCWQGGLALWQCVVALRVRHHQFFLRWKRACWYRCGCWHVCRTQLLPTRCHRRRNQRRQSRCRVDRVLAPLYNHASAWICVLLCVCVCVCGTLCGAKIVLVVVASDLCKARVLRAETKKRDKKGTKKGRKRQRKEAMTTTNATADDRPHKDSTETTTTTTRDTTRGTTHAELVNERSQ